MLERKGTAVQVVFLGEREETELVPQWETGNSRECLRGTELRIVIFLMNG